MTRFQQDVHFCRTNKFTSWLSFCHILQTSTYAWQWAINIVFLLWKNSLVYKVAAYFTEYWWMNYSLNQLKTHQCFSTTHFLEIFRDDHQKITQSVEFLKQIRHNWDLEFLHTLSIFIDIANHQHGTCHTNKEQLRFE